MKWSTEEVATLWEHLNAETDILKLLFPYRTKRQIIQKRHYLKREYQGGIVRMSVPAPEIVRLRMKENKNYVLDRVGKVKVLEIHKNVTSVGYETGYVLCRLLSGIKECFQIVDLNRVIKYKEVA